MLVVPEFSTYSHNGRTTKVKESIRPFQSNPSRKDVTWQLRLRNILADALMIRSRKELFVPKNMFLLPTLRMHFLANVLF